ncbi:hypothetical protein M3Y94_01015900 [Aphelenchoides besseyi]|nr:hypothetical protein M3Y94_01015900 [Aphelenchoides besseyi]
MSRELMFLSKAPPPKMSKKPTITAPNALIVLFADYKSGVTVVDSVRRIHAIWGDEAVGLEGAKKWFQKFRNGTATIDDGRLMAKMEKNSENVEAKKPRAPRKKKIDANAEGTSDVKAEATDETAPKPKKPRKKKTDQPQPSVLAQAQQMVKEEQPLMPLQMVGPQQLIPMSFFQPHLMAPVQESEHTIKVEMSECGYLQPKLEAMVEADKENSQTEEEWEDANQELLVEDVNVEDQW